LDSLKDNYSIHQFYETLSMYEASWVKHWFWTHPLDRKGRNER
jgi:hypothetical protein